MQVKNINVSTLGRNAANPKTQVYNTRSLSRCEGLRMAEDLNRIEQENRQLLLTITDSSSFNSRNCPSG
ncbi:unnamed protein product [Hermetia illucens]|uniref:Uncharacterized protein n=1 Tax=Hermetia illucens TaxID=343691 RepID=A0A7R8UXP6_HERIL|nr:unnamed protein product [Hermetia illucens]